MALNEAAPLGQGSWVEGWPCGDGGWGRQRGEPILWLSSRSFKAGALSWHRSATAVPCAEITVENSLLGIVVATG